MDFMWNLFIIFRRKSAVNNYCLVVRVPGDYVDTLDNSWYVGYKQVQHAWFACALRYHLAEGELGKEVKKAVMKGLAATGTFNTVVLPVNVREI